MKKLIIVVCFVLIALPCFGASTSTYVWYEAGIVKQLNITITCAAGSAEFTTTKIPYNLRGYTLRSIRSYPGGTAPTDATDLYIYQHSSSGKDILDGGGVDKLDATSTLTFFPLVDSTPFPVLITGDLWVAVSNNAVNAAIVTIELYLKNNN